MGHLHEGVFSARYPPTVTEYQLAVKYTAEGPECSPTIPTGTCPRSARWTCT